MTFELYAGYRLEAGEIGITPCAGFRVSWIDAELEGGGWKY